VAEEKDGKARAHLLKMAYRICFASGEDPKRKKGRTFVLPRLSSTPARAREARKT